MVGPPVDVRIRLASPSLAQLVTGPVESCVRTGSPLQVVSVGPQGECPRPGPLVLLSITGGPPSSVSLRQDRFDADEVGK